MTGYTTNRVFKYQVIEMDYVTLTDKKIEICKSIHRTNSRIVFWIIILSFKIKGIKYEVI